MVSLRRDRLSRETKIAIIASLFLHVAMIGLSMLIRLHEVPQGDHVSLVVEIPEVTQPPKSAPGEQGPQVTPPKQRSQNQEAPSISALVDTLSRTPELPLAPDSTLDSIRAQSPSFSIRPRLTFAQAESLAVLSPHLKQFLFREALVQAVVRDDSVYRAWHDPLLAALSLHNTPDELTSELGLYQQRFGTPYNPLRPPPAPNQIDIFQLVRGLSNLLRALEGN